MGIGQTLYSGSAVIGRGYAIFSAIIATVIGVLLIALGVYLLTRKDLHTKEVIGTIISAGCTSRQENNQTEYDCVVKASYTVGTQNYIKTFSILSPTDFEGMKNIKVYYNRSNPNDSVIYKSPTTLIGWGVIAFGVIIPLISLSWLYVVVRYKPVASVSGVYDVFRFF